VQPGQDSYVHNGGSECNRSGPVHMSESNSTGFEKCGIPASTGGEAAKVLRGELATDQRPYEKAGEEQVQKAVVCEEGNARYRKEANDTGVVIFSNVSYPG